jgi:hypothetical protein
MPIFYPEAGLKGWNYLFIFRKEPASGSVCPLSADALFNPNAFLTV